jgi:putative hemolysin
MQIKKRLREFMLQELHSIYPVYNNNYDDIVGVANLKYFCNYR